MDCPQVDQQGTFFQRIGLNRRRLPAYGSFELTFRCNLRCIHCYLGGRRAGKTRQPELSLEEIRGLFEQMAAAGTLWLLLTGGEPLLRPDFREIYTAAKRKGFVVSLFTNGTLLTPDLADFLADLPPHNTEITLYGATQATYERVTGVKGSYARCMKAIDLLMERGIFLRLKAMAMTLTAAEIPAMQAFAQGLGLEFRYDPILRDDLDGQRAPIPHRLPAQEVIRLELADPARVEEWQAFYYQQNSIEVNPDYLYSCGAGISTYHIDPSGRLCICMASRQKGYDLRQGSFKEGWEVFLRDVRLTPAPAASRCASCKLHPLCGLCPGWTDSGQVQPVEYLCQIAHQRAEAFGLTS